MTLSHLVFQGNRAFGTGGAIYFYNGTYTLTDVDFIGNAASSGGGMYHRVYETSGGLTLTRARFHDNDALGNNGWGIGGGLREDGNLSPLTLKTDVEFMATPPPTKAAGPTSPVDAISIAPSSQGNTATEAGGGLADEGAGCDLTDATFINNSAFQDHPTRWIRRWRVSFDR